MRRFEMIANRVVEAVKFDTRKEMQEYKREHHPEQGTKLQLRTDQEKRRRREGMLAGRVAATRELVCVKDGRVEVVKGEARSADVKDGDLLKVVREDFRRYYGMLDIRGHGFRHDPGLSGRPVRPGVFEPGMMEFAVLKENVGQDAAGRGFWAEWEER